MRDQLIKIIQEAVKGIQGSSSEARLLNIPVILSVPKNEGYGDYATNLAMLLAKELKQSPMKIAESLAGRIPAKPEWLEKIEVVKPGFINFFLKDQAIQAVLPSHYRTEGGLRSKPMGRGAKGPN